MKKKWDVNVKTFKDREKSVKKRNKDTGINGKQRYALDLRGSIKKKKKSERIEAKKSQNWIIGKSGERKRDTEEEGPKIRELNKKKIKVIKIDR